MRIPSGKKCLPHDESPDRMIDRGVFVTLVDRELQEMFGSAATAALLLEFPALDLVGGKSFEEPQIRR